MSASPTLRAYSTAGGRNPTPILVENGLETRKSLSEPVNGNDSVAELLNKDIKEKQGFFLLLLFLFLLRPSE